MMASGGILAWMSMIDRKYECLWQTLFCAVLIPASGFVMASTPSSILPVVGIVWVLALAYALSQALLGRYGGRNMLGIKWHVPKTYQAPYSIKQDDAVMLVLVTGAAATLSVIGYNLEFAWGTVFMTVVSGAVAGMVVLLPVRQLLLPGIRTDDFNARREEFRRNDRAREQSRWGGRRGRHRG